MNEFEVEDDWENFSPILILNLMFHLIFRSTWYARNYNSRYNLPVAYSIIKKMPIEENTRAIIEFVKYPISGLGLTSNDLSRVSRDRIVGGLLNRKFICIFSEYSVNVIKEDQNFIHFQKLNQGRNRKPETESYKEG